MITNELSTSPPLAAVSISSGVMACSTGRDTPPSSSESDPELPSPLNTTSTSSLQQVVDSKTTKEQQMYIWNETFEKWHECTLKFKPPYLYIDEYEDTRIEMEDKQLKHHKERWFFGNISRKEARCILQDYAGGDGSFIVRTSESYNGKFAISFVHEGRVKHVVIETKPDPVTGVLYHITPHGPCFDSLYSLIEEAKKTYIIKNHLFDVILTKAPPKPDCRWLHKNVKTLSQAEKMMKKETKDGSFFVYKTTSDYAPYSLVYRHEGSIIHTPIITGQRPSQTFTLHGTSAPVLYKLIHYYMENPINGQCVLEHPVKDNENDMSNCAIATCDCHGDPLKNELQFIKGALITNISRKSTEWCVGDHRGDRQKFFPTDVVRFLTKEELQYIKEVKLTLRGKTIKGGEGEEQEEQNHHPLPTNTQCINVQTDYTITFPNEGTLDIIATPITPILTTFGCGLIRLSCTTCRDMEQWYQVLEQHHCLPRRSSETTPKTVTGATGSKRKGRKKRGSCIIS